MRAPMIQHADANAGPSVGVIAEIGVNHDGSFDLAKQLIDAAKTAGADAVKFQCFDPATLLSGDGALAGYQRGGATDAKSMLAGLRLEPEALRRLRDYADGVGIGFVATPFSLQDVAVLADLGIDAVKIASPDAVNPWLLEAAAGLGVPMWVSTGTCDVDELAYAAGLLHGHEPGGALLHCVSAYPTPMPDAGLGGVAALRSAFGLTTGYSDHTLDEHTGAWAVAAGACLLEKHLTHDRTATGPDHAASLEPAGFARYIAAARAAAEALGPIAKRCTPQELDVRAVARQVLVYTRDLPAGHALTAADLETRRPATAGAGVPAVRGPDWIGRTLVNAVSAGSLAATGDVAAEA